MVDRIDDDVGDDDEGNLQLLTLAQLAKEYEVPEQEMLSP